MNCEQARELLAGYALEALDADERDAVARHLERCPDCARLAAALTATAHELPLALDTPEAPPLPASILARLRQATRTRTPTAARRAKPLLGRLRSRLAAAAVVALAAIAIVAAIRSQQAVADQNQLRARLAALVGQQSVVFDVVDSPHTTKALLLPARARSRAYGKIYIRTDSPDAVAFVNRLPQPAGTVRYLLWIRSRRTMVRAGIFSLHNGFGYLIFHHNRQTRLTDAFVTLQNPSSTPVATRVLTLARR